MNNELYHWNVRRGEEAKKHKYFRRELVKTAKGKNVYRYFYDKPKNTNPTNRKYTSTAPSQIKEGKMVDRSNASDEPQKKLDPSKKDEKVGLIFVPISKETLDNAAEWIADKFDKGDNKDKISDYDDSSTETDPYWDNYWDNYEPSEPSEPKWDDRKDTSTNDIDKYLHEFESDHLNDESNDEAVGDFVNENGNRIQFNDSEELEEAYLEYGNETEKQMVKDYGIKDRYYTPEEDMAEINEKFNDGPQYQNNCWSCSLAYDMRRRGFDVEAEESIDGASDTFIANTYNTDGVDPVWNSENIWSDSWGQAYGNKDPYEVAQDLEEKVIAEGNGARGVICVSWDPLIFGYSGHAMAWEVVDDHMVIRDCQTNDVYEGEYLAILLSYTTGYEYMRTDNLELRRRDGMKDRVNKN